MDIRRRGRARFGPFALDLETGELRKYDIKVVLQGQPFEVLAVLLEKPGELVTREELKERLWGKETYVDFDQGLNRAIKKVRAALNDSADIPKYVETFAKRGYRFVAPVNFESASSPIPAIEPEPQPGARVPKRWIKPAIAAGAVLAVAVIVCLLLLRHELAGASHWSLRQLTKNSAENSLTSAVISPDGNYLLYGDLAGIHLRLISTQETRTFGRPAEVSAQDGWFPVSWFPDQSRFVAVSAVSSQEGFKIKSWIVSALEGGITPLREDAFAQSVSPDGLNIAFTAGGPFLDQELWVTGTLGEKARSLASVGEQVAFSDIQWSPDSVHLAYVKEYFLSGVPYRNVIESRDLKGSPPETLVAQDDEVGGLCWLSDSRLAYGRLEGATNMWEIAVESKTGKAIGYPYRAIKLPAIDMMKISRSRDGKKAVFCRRTNRFDVYVGELDAKGKLREPRRLTLDEGNNVLWAWAPDNKSVIFTSDRSGPTLIYKQTIDERTAEPIVSEGERNQEPRISPDGRSIVYLVLNATGRGAKLMQIPLSGGPPHLLLNSNDDMDYTCARAPKTYCLLRSYLTTGQVRFRTLDMANGRAGDLFTGRSMGYCGGFAISPDGSEIAVMRSNFRKTEIECYSASGQLKQKLVVKGWYRLGGLEYSADGKAFYSGFFGMMGATLLRIDHTGRAEPIWSTPGSTHGTWAVEAPDGRHLAFSADGSTENAWMLDNL